MNKRVKVALLSFIIIVLVIASFYTYRRLNLMIKEDIILEVEDNYESVSLGYGESYVFKTEAEINNYWLCKASCEERIIDIDSGKLLFEETFYVSNNKKRSTSIEIMSPKGYGQSVYQYEIRCQNIPSNRCPTNNDTYVRKKTLMINHEPNSSQKVIISDAIALFMNISSNIAYSERDIDNATNIMYNIDVNFPSSLKERTLKYSSLTSGLRDSESKIIYYWNDDDYESAYDHILATYYPSEELAMNASGLLDEVHDMVLKHNSIVRTHRANLQKAAIIKEMLRNYPGDIEELRNDAITSLALVNINTVKMNKLENYDVLLREVQLEKSNIDDTMASFDSKAGETKADYVDIYLADALACSVLGCNSTEINYSSKSIEDVKYRCRLYNEIMPRFLDAHNMTKANRDPYNGSLDYFDDRENAVINSLLDDLQVNDSTIMSRVSEYISLLNSSNNSNTSFTISEASPQMFFSLEFQPMIDSLNNISAYCGRPSQNFSFDEYIIYEQFIPEFEQQLELKRISQPLQKCCFFGDCRECRTDKRDPLILLHGHSFNQKNSAYQSTDIFNQLEPRLESEGYVSLGIWKPYADPKNIILENVLLKPTYYITTYNDILGTSTIQSKDESIEEYSERLKGTIDNIKLITGSNKVDIVAHSMGGLVVRKYIQEYGPEDIDDLIMIGTPNNGITDRVHSVCKLFGNEKECDEMHQGSEFMKALNNVYEMPDTYLIIGKGCDMQGKDGDGVVTAESSKLEKYKTYYIEGNCTSASFLHNSMLNREDVAEKIINIID